MKKLVSLALLLGLALCLSIWGCSGSDDDDNNGNNNPIVPGPVADMGSITGLVRDTGDTPVEGATIEAGGASTTSNQDGYFVLAQVPEGERVVTIVAAGRMATFRTLTIEEGASIHLPDLVLAAVRTTTFNSTSGGTAVSEGGTGTVDFDADGFQNAGGQAYTGEVTVELNAFTPESDDFYGAFPGEFEGVREDDSITMFESFGFMTVNMYGANKAPLELTPGNTAALTLEIGAAKAATAPATIPMWYFDEDDGRWYEEGEAVLNGTAYETEVSHFTTWNWDLPVDDICTIEGYVVDEFDNPVAGARVISSGVDYAIRDEAETDAAGHFSVRARKNSQTDVWALFGSRVSDAARVDVGESCPVNMNGSLELTVPRFSVSLTWGLTPADLDAYLYIPMPWDDGQDPDFDEYLLDFGSEGSMSAPPYTALDTDDQDSFGPEIITATRFYPGTYQYWVDNWSTDLASDLRNSGAQVRLEIAGGIWIFNAADLPAPTAGSADMWHVFDFTVGANGNVSVDPVDEFAPERMDGPFGPQYSKARIK